jgi:Protein SCAI
MLYRPSFAQIQMFLATCFKDLSENSSILLYISADGSDCSKDIYKGGVTTCPTRKVSDQPLVNTFQVQDLIPYTRKPVFLIIDSSNSHSFQAIPNCFDQVLVCLMSSQVYPSENGNVGSLFSLFLHSPLKAFCFLVGIGKVERQVWKRGVEWLERIENVVEELISDESVGSFSLIL